MKLLALEASTEACSVALSCDGEVTVDHRIAPQQHAKLLLPMIEGLLSAAGLNIADLNGIAFGCGPGSFTGVRIATATTQGIAFGADIGVVPVSSLHALAQGALREENASRVVAAIDARMGEIYWGAYERNAEGIAVNTVEDTICPPAELVAPPTILENDWFVVGSGANEYQSILHDRLGTEANTTFVADKWPSAQDVLSVALPKAINNEFVTAAEAMPVYLRNQVAFTEAERAEMAKKK